MSLHFSYETIHMEFGKRFRIFSHSIGIHNFYNIFFFVFCFFFFRRNVWFVGQAIDIIDLPIWANAVIMLFVTVFMN